MSVNEIHELDIGTVFRATIKDGSVVVDVSGATTQKMIFKPPKGAIKSKPTVFDSDGTDGKIKYTTIADDLDEVGFWELQAYIVMPSGEWRSDIYSFEVFSNL